MAGEPNTTRHRELSELGSTLSLESSTIFSYEKIGAGTCGTVFAPSKPDPSGFDLALKIAKHDTDALTGDLFNDFKMHNAVQPAMQSFDDGVNFARVPSFHSYIPSQDPWWEQNAAFSAAAVEKGIQVPSKVLCTERIAPLPSSIRSALIEQYCPEVSKARAHEDPSNKDCLVRVYLGAHRGEINPRSTFFSLRNYKLHLDQMMQLGMDVKVLAYAMAGTLARLHWKARIDAKDIEFVLGLSPQRIVRGQTDAIVGATGEDTYVGPETKSLCDWYRQSINLWVLDFNLCSKITMDEAGVEMAAKAWQINDPYYPKPRQDKKEDRELWNVFVLRYIEVSDHVLQSDPELRHLPREFVASIVRIQEEKDARKAHDEKPES